MWANYRSVKLTTTCTFRTQITIFGYMKELLRILELYGLSGILVLAFIQILKKDVKCSQNFRFQLCLPKIMKVFFYLFYWSFELLQQHQLLEHLFAMFSWVMLLERPLITILKGEIKFGTAQNWNLHSFKKLTIFPLLLKTSVADSLHRNQVTGTEKSQYEKRNVINTSLR